MSDWEDEPAQVGRPLHGNANRDSTETTAKSRNVSEWSDEDKPNENRQGGGDGNGYRGRRDNGGGGGGYSGRRDDGEGGGGYRGRRDDGQGGGGGYRGRRDDGEGGGGYRGRRDDGEGGGGYRGRRDDGEGGGGYRGRRDDGEGGGGYRKRTDNNEEDGGYRGRNNDGGRRGRRDDDADDYLMFFNFNVPKSYDKETIAAFLKDLNLNAASQSLVELRKKRDYLLKAFSILVEQEWTKQKETERNQRGDELKRLCPAVVNMSTILPDIEEFLNQPKDILQQLHRLDLNLRQMDEQQMQVQEQEQQQQPEQQLELQLDDDAIVVPGQSRNAVTRTSYSTSGRRALRDRNVAKEQNLESVIKRIRNLLKKAARSYELNDGIVEPIDEELAVESSMERGDQRVPTRWLSENFMSLREMRKPHYFDTNELQEPLSWPLGIDKRIWLSNRQPPLSLNMWFVQRANESSARREQDVEQEQLDLELALPRQDLQSRSQNTPSHGGFLPLSVQDSGNNAAAMINSNTASISNDGLSAVQMTSGGGNQAANLSAEDMYAMCPPPMPPVTPNDGDNFSMLPMGGPITSTTSAAAAVASSSTVVDSSSVSASLVLRSRHAFASTPYRTQLPAIDEEPLQQQQLRPSTMPRVLELNETSTAESTIGATIIEATAMTRVDIVASITPPMPRDWASIFRPRTALPNYTIGVGYENLLTPPRGLRRRKRKRRQPDAGAAVATDQNELEQIVNVQPPSNDELMLDYLSNLFQQIWSTVEQPMAAAADGGAAPAAIEQAPVEAPDGAAGREPAAVETREVLSLSMSMKRTTVVEVSATPTLPMDMDVLPEGSTLALALPEQGERSKDPKQFPLSIDELPEMPVVTSIQIIQQPSSAAVDAGQSINDLNETTMTIPNTSDKSSRTTEEIRGKRVERELRESLSFIVEHKHLLRLMVDHNIHLSAKQQKEDQLRNPRSTANRNNYSLSDDNNDSEGVRYVSIPAMYTYDPQIVLKMSEVKLSVIHKLIGALVRNNRVDLRAKGFFETRMEAAIGYRVLFELKAANIISLDAAARYAMLL